MQGEQLFEQENRYLKDRIETFEEKVNKAPPSSAGDDATGTEPDVTAPATPDVIEEPPIAGPSQNVPDSDESAP